MNTNFIIRNKKAFLSLSLILMLAMTLMMALAQPSLAQVGIAQPEKTVGYISVAPTLIGVGQTLTCNPWVFPLPTTYFNIGYFNGFYGITVTFVRPDGTKDTFMPTDETGAYIAGEMSSLGSMVFFYKPSMAGNWSVSWTMPAQNITDSHGTIQYLGCTSNTAYFTVQTDPVLAGLLNGYPWAQLPNSNVYWSYPINDNNREWSQISGDWTGITDTSAAVVSSSCLRWQRYGSGPNTAHIVWTNLIKEIGIEGGDYGSVSYFGGANGDYGAPQNTVVVMDGMAFTNIPNTRPVGQAFSQFRCINEATGQVLYNANGTITCGIHLPGSTYTQTSLGTPGQAEVLLESSYGSYEYPYLYGTITVNNTVYWNYYDPLTGVLVRQINNASTAKLIDGTVLGFGAANSPTILGGAYVYRWNMTSVATTGANANQWVTGITWKVPLPTTFTGSYPSLFAVSPDGTTVIVGTRQQYWGYNADTGASLWNITLPYPVTSNEEIPLANVNDFLVFDSVAATYHLYSMATGAQLWESTSFASSPWATTWTVYRTETNDLNNLYVAQPDGSMRAFSLTDGHLLWTSMPFASTEYPNNAVPFVYTGLILVDGKLYGYAGYSIGYEIDPVPRFAMMVCANATSGDIVFTLNGGVQPAAAANGYLQGSGVFDGQLYCLGKGQTSTTVSAPQTAITAGTPVIISGTVLDQSAAQPNTAAISDANMSVWMDYLHMQNSTLLNTPPDCIGVPVTLTAVDPNGNAIAIGTTTSNYKGSYGLQWTPTTAGIYTIYASFAGSDSYYSSSSAFAYATVSSATASTTSTPAPTSTAQSSVSNSDMLMYLAIGVIVIVIAIAIVGALILRKK